MSEFNDRIIAEFREHGGKVGPPFEGAPMVLLTTIGRKSGKQFTTPLVYKQEGERIVVFASYAGAPKNPAWFDNLVANPSVIVEVGTERYGAIAEVITGAERDRIYAEQVAIMPGFGDYEKKTERVIPVVALNRA